MGSVPPPREDDAPLAIDPDGMSPLTIAAECLETIARRDTQVFQSLGSVQCSQLPACCDREIAGHATRQTADKNQRRRLVAKAPDHGFT